MCCILANNKYDGMISDGTGDADDAIWWSEGNEGPISNNN
jgi:hypothetical protein